MGVIGHNIGLGVQSFDGSSLHNCISGVDLVNMIMGGSRDLMLAEVQEI